MSDSITPVHCQHTHAVKLSAFFCYYYFLQPNNYAATFSMSNFALSPFVRDKTAVAQKQHHLLQEHLLPLSYSDEVWKSCWIIWRASTSISSTDIYVLPINTDFLLQLAARKAAHHNCLKAWRKKFRKEKRTRFTFLSPTVKYTWNLLIIHDCS